MKAIERTVAMVVAIALLALLGTGIYVAAKTIVTRFAALDREVATVLLMVCTVALASAWIIARGIGAASRRTRAVALREEKAATYQLLLDFWVNRLQPPSPRSVERSAEMTGKLEALDRLLALYGSAAVITAHATLRNELRQQRDGKAFLAAVLVAVRKDLGTDTPHTVSRDLEQLLLPPLEEGALA